MNYVIDKEWLLKNLRNHEVRIADCRFSLSDPEKGIEEYTKGHLPGAVFFDIAKDLSSPVGIHGGRHPFPDIDLLIEKLENTGITNDTVLIAYDNGEGSFAARFWWLLHYLGHEKVFVLDGGFKEWNECNYPITKDIPSFAHQELLPNIKQEIFSVMEEVRGTVLNRMNDVVLIDSREPKRYLGIEEPIDKKAGHIPGAINKPWMEGFQDGRYKSVEDQKKRFEGIDKDKQLIVYCGSGITAAPNFLALKEAGFEKVKLYVGSFSDWISYPENNIE